MVSICRSCGEDDSHRVASQFMCLISTVAGMCCHLHVLEWSEILESRAMYSTPPPLQPTFSAFRRYAEVPCDKASSFQLASSQKLTIRGRVRRKPQMLFGSAYLHPDDGGSASCRDIHEPDCMALNHSKLHSYECNANSKAMPVEPVRHRGSHIV
jgi:hypothetical protein